jgi:hypothetical protein
MLGAAAFALFLTTAASADNHGVTFTRIGFIDQTSYPVSSVWDMNPQGTIFLVSPSPFFDYYVEWTRDGGWGTHIGASLFPPHISSGGVVMSNGVYPGSDPVFAWPGLWTGVENGWDPIPSQPGYSPCGDAELTGYGMGGEGDYIAGLTWQGCNVARAFKWDKATNTTVDLGTPNGKSTRGNAISSDGSKVVGFGTMLFGFRRGAVFQNGTASFLGDPNGLETTTCAKSGKPCTVDSPDPTYGCPGEYVHDGYCAAGSCQNKGTCQNKGSCSNNVCVGGANAGAFCWSDALCLGACVGGANSGALCTDNTPCGGACVGGNNSGAYCIDDTPCTGTCAGPNAGAECTQNYECPDTPVCVDNPNWTDDLYKGETWDLTPDGRYAVGEFISYSSTSGYRANPDGTFTEMAPPATWPYHVLPIQISADGKTAVGRLGTFWDGYSAFVWREDLGTIDLQLFMEAQGIQDMSSWYLYETNTVSADGTVIAGLGINPDNLVEGFIIDMKKVWVCHTPPGNPKIPRTLGIDIDSVAAHLSHGDFLGTCEFQQSGGLPQADATRRAKMSQASAMFSPVSPKKFSTEQFTPWVVPLTQPKIPVASPSHPRVEQLKRPAAR